MHVFLTGPVQIGKSTLIARTLEACQPARLGGFRTVSSAAKQTYKSVRMILSQRCKKAFQCHCVMCIVNHQRKFIGYFDHLYTTFDSGNFECSDDILLRNFKMTANCDCSQ